MYKKFALHQPIFVNIISRLKKLHYRRPFFHKDNTSKGFFFHKSDWPATQLLRLSFSHKKIDQYSIFSFIVAKHEARAQIRVYFTECYGLSTPHYDDFMMC